MELVTKVYIYAGVIRLLYFLFGQVPIFRIFVWLDGYQQQTPIDGRHMLMKRDRTTPSRESYSSLYTR